MLNFKTIKKEEEGIVTEKKSKFIATIIPVYSRIEAEEIIKKIKKKYADARHNCYAYCILEDEAKITKSSDDGEPSGTAGIPILKVINENELCNVLVVVTRYFGGILLGTGGLQRAYTEATVRAIENCELINKKSGYEMEIGIKYSDLNYIRYYLEQSSSKIIDIEYLEEVKIKIEISENQKEEIENRNSIIGNKIQNIYNITKKYI